MSEENKNANASAAAPEDHLKKPEKNNTHAFRTWAELNEDQISGEANRRIKAFNAGLEAPHPNETFAWAMEQRIFAHFYMLGCLSYIIDRQHERLAMMENVIGAILKERSQELSDEVSNADTDGGEV